MIKPRADLGFGSALDDLGGFEFKANPIARPPKTETARVAQAAGFQSREPLSPPQPAPPQPAPIQPAPSQPAATQRRRRTGRNVQFNIKTTPETITAFCAIADANGWGLGETLERATALLQRDVAKA